MIVYSPLTQIAGNGWKIHVCLAYLTALTYAGMFTYVWSYLRTYLILSSLKNQNVLKSSIYFLETEHLPFYKFLQVFDNNAFSTKDVKH